MSGMIAWGRVTAAALVASVCLIAPPGAASTPERQTLVLVRTTSGPASYSLLIEGSTSPAQPDGMQVQIAARLDSRGRVQQAASLGAQTFHYDRQPAAQASGTRVEVCEPVGGCIVHRTLGYTSGTQSKDNGGVDVFNRLFVIIEGRADISFKGQGWRLERRPLAYRYAVDQDADAAGVFTGGGAYQVFHRARLPGGKRGSIAAAQPPCSTSAAAGAAVPRGVGTMRLDGGKQSGELTCPLNLGTAAVTRWSDTGTTWTASGPVVGDSKQSNVPLTVLDLNE